jgi:hypothetical protein
MKAGSSRGMAALEELEEELPSVPEPEPSPEVDVGLASLVLQVFDPLTTWLFLSVLIESQLKLVEEVST